VKGPRPIEITTHSLSLEHLGIDVNMVDSHTWVSVSCVSLGVNSNQSRSASYIVDTTLSEEKLPSLSSLSLSSFLGIRNHNRSEPATTTRPRVPKSTGHSALNFPPEPRCSRYTPLSANKDRLAVDTRLLGYCGNSITRTARKNGQLEGDPARDA
jgi:hypothetical protein